MDLNIWEQILTRIEAKVNHHSYSTWFKPTAFLRDSGHTITVRVPKPMYVDWLTKHYSVVLAEALTSVGPRRHVRGVPPAGAVATRPRRRLQPRNPNPKLPTPCRWAA